MLCLVIFGNKISARVNLSMVCDAFKINRINARHNFLLEIIVGRIF